MTKLISVLVMLISAQSFAQSRLCSRDSIERAKDVLYACGVLQEDEDVDGSAQPECMNYVMGKGYGPSTAKEACLNISEGKFSCVKTVVDKGYSPATAAGSCDKIGRKQKTCFDAVVAKGYSPSTAQRSCAGVTKAQGQCIIDVIARGYSPVTGRQNCL